MDKFKLNITGSIDPRNDANHIKYRIEEIQDESHRLNMRDVLEELIELYLSLYHIDDFFGEFMFDELEKIPFLILMDKIHVEDGGGAKHVRIEKTKMILDNYSVKLMVMGIINQQKAEDAKKTKRLKAA